MSSESLSPQEAHDLLHKLVTESTRVQGAFVSPVSGVRAVVWDVIRVSSTFSPRPPVSLGPRPTYPPTSTTLRPRGTALSPSA